MQVSNHFKDFVAYYVEDAVFNGEPVHRRKYLKRYSAFENCDYDTLQENLFLLIDALNEYKEEKTEVSLKIAKYQVKFCYLPEQFIDAIADKILSWKSASPASYVNMRGGDIFNEMPGGHLLKEDQWRYFDFDEYVEEAESSPERKDVIERYMKKYKIKKNSYFEEHPIYVDYLSKFNMEWDVVTPEETVLFSSEDWNLLSRLIFASDATSYSLILDDDWKRKPTERVKVHISIKVSYQGQETTKMLDELWSFQIMRLFRSYIDQQINYLMSLVDDDEKELFRQREAQIEIFEKEKKKIMKEIKKYL